MKKIYISIVMVALLLSNACMPLYVMAQLEPETKNTPPIPTTQNGKTNQPTGIPAAGTSTPSSGALSGKGCKSASCIRDLLTLLQYAIYLVQNYLVSLIFALALIFFLWNVALFIWRPGDAKNKSENLQNIAKGVGGLFIMFAIYGILAMISNTLNIGIGGTMEIPAFKIGK